MTKKVAILCSGLDNVMRGYETHCRTLFDCLSTESVEDVEFVLFKRQGEPKKNEVVLKVPYRSDFLCQFLAKYRGDLLYWEYLFFALRFLLHCFLRRKKFETISVIEPMAAKTIFKFKWLLPGKPVIVFTHGVWNHPSDNINNADVFHEVSVENYDNMKEYIAEKGLRKKVVLLPHFLKDTLFPEVDKEQLKRELGVKTSKVVLSVGAINRGHKRMDHLIEEVAGLPSDWTLVVCGGASGADGQKLLKEGKDKLGERFVHLFMKREEIWKVYQAADIFVLASTQEGFGIVILEAMQAGLPVILHKRKLFQWILMQEDCCVDMKEKGALLKLLNKFGSDPVMMKERSELNKKIFFENYSWSGLKEKYLQLLLNTKP